MAQYRALIYDQDFAKETPDLCHRLLSVHEYHTAPKQDSLVTLLNLLFAKSCLVFLAHDLIRARQFIHEQFPFIICIIQNHADQKIYDTFESWLHMLFPQHTSHIMDRPILCYCHQDDFGWKVKLKTPHNGEYLEPIGHDAESFFKELSIPRHFEHYDESPTSTHPQIQSPLFEPNWLVKALESCYTSPCNVKKSAIECFNNRQSSNTIDWELIVNNWTFHSPDFDHQQCLTAAWYMFNSLGLFESLRIDIPAFQSFLLTIEANYRLNPYHNFHHAVDVMQCIYYFLRQVPTLTKILQPIEQFGLLLSAFCHDVSHTGLNNQFMVRDQSALACLYNNRSVLENLHAMLIFAMLRQKENDFWVNWSWEERKQLQHVVIQCVLGTDMDSHGDILERIRHQLGPRRNALDPDRDDLSFEERTLMCVGLIKCADLCNTIRPFAVARRWGFRLIEEFFQIGDFEQSIGLSVTPMFDRKNLGRLPEDQVFFLSRVASPLFSLMSELVPGLRFTLTYLEANIDNWRNWKAEPDPEVVLNYVRPQVDPREEKSSKTE